MKLSCCGFADSIFSPRRTLKRLPVTELSVAGRSFYRIGEALPSGDMPACVFLAGLDQLMLGYEKSESIFLPREHMRDIFAAAGIVRPAILVNGSVAGWWQKRGRKLTLTVFEEQNKAPIFDAASRFWTSMLIGLK